MNQDLLKLRFSYLALNASQRQSPIGQQFLSAIDIAGEFQTLLLELAASAQAFRDRVVSEGIELHRLDTALKKVAHPMAVNLKK